MDKLNTFADKTEQVNINEYFSRLIINAFPLKVCIIDLETEQVIYSNFKHELPDDSSKPCCYRLAYDIKSPCRQDNFDCRSALANENKSGFFSRCDIPDPRQKYRLPEMYCVPIFNSEGKAKYIVQYLIESPLANKFYEDAINRMQLGLCVYKLETPDDDSSLRIIATNEFSTVVTGMSAQEKLGKKIDEVFPHLRAAGVPSMLANVVKTNKAHELEDVCYRSENMKNSIMRVKAYPLPDNCVGVIFEDVTEKQRILEKLVKSESLFNLISESALDAIIMIDDNDKIYYWNKAAERIFGYTREEAIGRGCHKLLAPARYHDNIEKGLREFGKTGKGEMVGESLELRGLKKNGEEVPVELSIAPVPVDGKWHAISILRDITRQIEARNDQARMVAQYTELINAVHAEMYIKDKELRYEIVNKAFCKAAEKNREDIIGHTVFEIWPKQRAEIYHKEDLDVIETGQEIINKEVKLTNSNGETLWFSHTKIPIYDESGQFNGLVGLNQDVTAIQLSKQQLMQSEKLAAIGTLAAGVAHEINNPMGYISSNLNTMAKYVNKIENYYRKYEDKIDDDTREEFEEIITDFRDAIIESQEGAQRVKKIVTDLKTFSRVDKSEMEMADINEGIESTLNIVWNEMKYNCKVEKDYSELPDLYCNLNQLNQVFMNLLVNASHAINHKQGLVKIRTWAKSSSIFISIQDNGSGIPPENFSKIFEPFFTTKEVGKGTGLGLSLVYDIIQKHHGEIEVKSEENVGTEFIIKLPIRTDQDDKAHDTNSR